MLLFTIIFTSHFASVWPCSVCLGGIVLGEITVLHLEMRPNSIQSNKTQEIGTEKILQSVIVRLTSRAEKALRQRNKRFDRGTLTSSP